MKQILYYKCHQSCKSCFGPSNKSSNAIGNEFENINTNCLQCNTKDEYYPLYKDNSSCHNRYTIMEGYYLDRNIDPFIWKQCPKKCETFNEDCISKCQNEDEYVSDINECIMNNNERKGIIFEFENKILNNITLYFNSTQIFNGTVLS